MRIVKRICLLTVVFVIALAAVVAIRHWNSLRSIYIGVKESSEEISKSCEKNQKQLLEEVDKYMDDGLRELSPEEKAQIEKGEISPEEIYSRLFEEKAHQIRENAQKENQDGQTEEKNNSELKKENAPKPTKDELVSECMSKLYALQSEFTARTEITVKQGAYYYEELKKTQGKAVARANTIAHYTPIVNSIESECDAKAEAIISKLEKELKEIGENIDIVRTIKSGYENEKQLKLSYYANKHLK